MKKAALFLITTLFLGALPSCSAEWHLRKAISKDPSIVLNQPEITVIDTTVIWPSVRTDTTFLFLPSDTITIEKERLRVQIKRINDTIKVFGECEADTIRIVEKVQLPPRIKYAPRKWYDRMAWPLIFVVLSFFVARSIFDRWANNS